MKKKATVFYSKAASTGHQARSLLMDDCINVDEGLILHSLSIDTLVDWGKKYIRSQNF